MKKLIFLAVLFLQTSLFSQAQAETVLEDLKRIRSLLDTQIHQNDEHINCERSCCVFTLGLYTLYKMCTEQNYCGDYDKLQEDQERMERKYHYVDEFINQLTLALAYDTISLQVSSSSELRGFLFHFEDLRLPADRLIKHIAQYNSENPDKLFSSLTVNDLNGVSLKSLFVGAFKKHYRTKIASQMTNGADQFLDFVDQMFK